VYKGSPLKNVGFQINNGANPHFTKIEKSKTNQINPKANMSRVVLILIKKRNIYSTMYQSKVSILK
jgi:hypothetical protein